MLETRAKLLIADDEPSIRLAMSHVLTEIGYQVRSAQDGFSALAEMRRETPDILLSDLNMPGMSGFELLSVVRRRFPAVQTIAMSGAFHGDEVPSGVAADAFYQKGSSLGSLLKIMGALHHMERRDSQPCRVGAPLWIRRSGIDSSGKMAVTITCPECLRTSPQALDGSASPMREVSCVHCGNTLQCAIAERPEQTMPLPFQRNARAAKRAQSASKRGN